MGDIANDMYESGIALQEIEAVPKVKKPPMYKVVIYNDDFTPMDFVVEVLMGFFAMTTTRANMVMMEVHNKGRGECGVYSRDVAETKVAQVNSVARSHDYPLLCAMESV